MKQTIELFPKHFLYQYLQFVKRLDHRHAKMYCLLGRYFHESRLMFLPILLQNYLDVVKSSALFHKKIVYVFCGDSPVFTNFTSQSSVY